MIRSKKVTAQYLLEGAFFATEQCGLLLNDALSLCEHGRGSTALALAAFAREELGRSLILFDLRRDLISGKTVTLKDIEDKCRDHVEKQKRGQLSTVQRADRDTGLGKLMQSMHLHAPQTEEWKDARRQLDDLTERQRKRTPSVRHGERMSSLYVEPDESGTGWNRPCDKSPQRVKEFIVDAVNDYAGRYDRLQGGSVTYSEPDGPELWDALQAWERRPELPRPEWP